MSNTVDIKGVEVKLHTMYDAKYFQALFNELTHISEEAEDSAKRDADDVRVINTCILAREFCDPDVYKGLITLREYVKQMRLTKFNITVLDHADYKTLRSHVISDLRFMLNDDIRSYFLEFI